MTIPQSPRRPRARTQASTILGLLERHPGHWTGVDLLMFESRCAAVHSVISTLRTRYGFQIENRQHRACDGQARSSYRLIGGTPTPTPAAP